jgi:Holliday junction resolvase RusA-like endonuclease
MSIALTIQGQIRGGKNNMLVLRNGMHIPRPEWRRWRDDAVAQIRRQYAGSALAAPCSARIRYYAGDAKRRDVPAIMDAIWHALERAGVVEDDYLIQQVRWETALDRARPRCEIELEVM